MASILDEIPGIGPKTKQLLLRKWHSVKRIAEADEAELATVVGPAKAKNLKQMLAQNTEKS